MLAHSVYQRISHLRIHTKCVVPERWHHLFKHSRTQTVCIKNGAKPALKWSPLGQRKFWVTTFYTTWRNSIKKRIIATLLYLCLMLRIVIKKVKWKWNKVNMHKGNKNFYQKSIWSTKTSNQRERSHMCSKQVEV